MRADDESSSNLLKGKHGLVFLDFYDVNMSTSQKAKLTVNFLAFPAVNFLKLGGVVTKNISYKIPYFC